MKAKTVAKLAIALLSIEAPFFMPLEIESHNLPGSGGHENKLPIRRGSGEAKVLSPFPLPLVWQTTRVHSFRPSTPMPIALTSSSCSKVRKILFFTTMGVDEPAAGSGIFQSKFSVSLQESGSFVESLRPSLPGPRQVRQSARSRQEKKRKQNA